MDYISTRSKNSGSYKGASVIKQGLAPDGGLFVPENIPALTQDDMKKLLDADYTERAAFILSKFFDDYTYEELKSAAESAYGNGKFPVPPAPISKVGKRYFLELWHGPTSAFKDMALQIMPIMLSLALKKTGEDRRARILVATSGDTGKAALEGFADVENVEISVFYPAFGVSNIQKKQMASQKGKNVNVYAIRGNFDDAQNGVKMIFSDPETREKLDKKGVFLSSANSINWGRLAPQIVYYVSAYLDLVKEKEIKMGDILDVTVPTGNFGNILACFIAKKMGLPIEKLVCASNMNNILTDFLTTGEYDRNRRFYTTVSPSMDILISSNLERLIYFFTDACRTKEYMDSLAKTGKYRIDEDTLLKIKEYFACGFCDEENTKKTIKKYFSKYGYLCDTHTAVAANVADGYIEKTGSETPMLVVSTASPYKFAPAVLSSLGEEVPKDDFEALNKLFETTKCVIPKNLSELSEKEDRFKEIISPSEMKEKIISQ